ncbi:MAG: hypothetical protein F6K19_30855, partial [Cyanothece sp. SIO1E1]|nr:hypothetical protein [Cyanothece sp. SIO1E1]
LITLKVAKILKGRSAPLNHFWTFEEHYHYFKKDLRFTAVNLETKKVHILSKDTTPRLPVATAVRMSMSLPLVFKPVILTKDYIWKKQMEPFWEGVWVDGGLFDNTPIRTFNSDKSLLFRLGDTERTKIESLGSFLKAWLVYVGVFGSGSGQVTETTYKYYQTSVIELNIDSTSLLKFNLDKTSLEKLTKANSRITRSYFARTTLPN